LNSGYYNCKMNGHNLVTIREIDRVDMLVTL
jgi:hypothetical protein